MRNHPTTRITLLAALAAVCLHLSPGTVASTPDPKDRHYNTIGFFDMHVCNWPDRSIFLMPLLSTAHYDDIDKVDVLYPDGKQLAEFNLSRFRILETEDAAEKHVFINQIGMPDDAVEGWYSARITMKNGDVHTASDYIVLSKLERAGGQTPGHEQTLVSPPQKLTWEPVPGAGYYQVFIRDQWDDNKLIYTSRLLTGPELPLPPDLIKEGGYYSWIVHARDINEDIILGDFNSGSLSNPVSFSVSQ